MITTFGRAWRGFTAVAAVAGAMAAAAAVAGNAYAGECPAGQMMAGAGNAGHAAKGVTDTVLTQIDLGAERIALQGHNMRVRRLVIQPGGIVPWHSHEARPALIYVVSGQIYEYASTCAVPILHKAGDVAREYLGTRHWWKNSGAQPVDLTIGDIVNDHKPDTMMEKMM